MLCNVASRLQFSYLKGVEFGRWLSLTPCSLSQKCQYSFWRKCLPSGEECGSFLLNIDNYLPNYVLGIKHQEIVVFPYKLEHRKVEYVHNNKGHTVPCKRLKISWVKRDQLDVTCFIISLFNAQYVSDVSTSILRSLRLMCWVISWVALLWFDVCWCYVVVWLWWCGIRMQAEALVLQACILIPHHHSHTAT